MILSDDGFVKISELENHIKSVVCFSKSNQCRTVINHAPRNLQRIICVSRLTLEKNLFSKYQPILPDPFSLVNNLEENAHRDISSSELCKIIFEQAMMQENLAQERAASEEDSGTTGLIEVPNVDEIRTQDHDLLFSSCEFAQKILSALDSMIIALKEIQDIKENTKAQIAKLDNAIIDELHYIEFYPLSGSDGYLAYKRMRELRKQRRVLKNQLECSKLVSEVFESTSLSDVRRVQNLIWEKNARVYRLREPELFRHNQRVKGK